MSNDHSLEPTAPPGFTFDWRISIGNIIAILTMLGTVLIFYVKATAHISDSQLHQTQTQKEALIDDRVELHIAPIEAKMIAQHAEIMRSLARLEAQIEAHEKKEN